MHPREQYKNVPNKNKQTLIPKKTQTSNYTKHNRKRQSVEHCTTTTNKERRKAYSQQPSPERSERQSNTIPPLNPEARGMSGPEPPPTEARLHGWLLQYFPLTLYKITFSNVTLKRSPAGSVPCDSRQGIAKHPIVMFIHHPI